MQSTIEYNIVERGGGEQKSARRGKTYNTTATATGTSTEHAGYSRRISFYLCWRYFSFSKGIGCTLGLNGVLLRWEFWFRPQPVGRKSL